MKKTGKTWLVFVVCLSLWQCNSTDQKEPNTLFERLRTNETGITFNNIVTPTKDLNLISYEYMYNGGGVGIGDFNADGLPDIFLTGNMVVSEIYINQEDLKFKNITQTSGIDTKGNWCTGASIIDINNDGFDDIYISVGGAGNTSTHPNLLYVNNQDLTFVEQAADYGLDNASESIQSVFFDYDRDGDLDMYQLNGGGFEKSAIVIRPILENGESRNNDNLFQCNYDSTKGHNVYRDVSKNAGIVFEGFGLGVSVIDANLDGWPDLYVSNDYISRDLLYINTKDGKFKEEGLQRLKHTSHFSMGNAMADINNDGFWDIMTVDMLPEDHFRRKMMSGPNQYDRYHQATAYNYGHQQMRNMLQMGNGHGGFDEIGQLSGIDRTDWSWSPLIGDFDNDGWQDIYVTNGYGEDITDLDFVNFGQNAHQPFGGNNKNEEELLNRMKSLPEVKVSNFIFKNNGDLTFSDVTKQWTGTEVGISNGSAFADFDNDGDLDIITNNINEEVSFWENNLNSGDSISSAYIKLKLKGPADNKSAIGTTVAIYNKGNAQKRYVSRTMGFQSSTWTEVHIGIGEAQSVDSMVVLWPDNQISALHDIQANQTVVVDYQKSKSLVLPRKIEKDKMFSKERIAEIKFTESLHSDFKNQSLLLQSCNNLGPSIAVGDINNDGLDDAFVGGPYGSNAKILYQKNDGEFEIKNIESKKFEDTGSVLFDADNDGDLDIYVASGGAERYKNHEVYVDRLYMNQNGNFVENQGALPNLLSSTSSVVAADYDQDGDLDLFVGGRVVPGRYPEIPESYILENQNGVFSNVSDALSPGIKNMGMVTSAIWTDFNNDQKQDLIVVGELMEIKIFKNIGGGFEEVQDQLGIGGMTGLWNSISSADFDNDGDTDYILGNYGLNNPYANIKNEGVRLDYADFDQNGSMDPIISVYEEDKYYPFASLNMIAEQLPILKKKTPYYRDYANLSTDEFLKIFPKINSKTTTASVLKSVVIENKGDHFKIIDLPHETQLSSIYGISCRDVNSDGLIDVVLVGNNKMTEVVYGKQDALNGLILLNNGGLEFSVKKSNISGFYSPEDSRALTMIKNSGGQLSYLVGKNELPLEKFSINDAVEIKTESFNLDEVSAEITFLKGKKQKLEYHIGSGYLSQESRLIILPKDINTISFYNAKGLQTRLIKN